MAYIKLPKGWAATMAIFISCLMPCFLSDSSRIIALPCHYKSLSNSLLILNFWICKRFLKVVKCQMDLSKLLHESVKVVTNICQSCNSDFSIFICWKKNWSLTKFQSLLKPLLWTKGVKLVKVLSALGLLCPWQCFYKSKLDWFKSLWTHIPSVTFS